MTRYIDPVPQYLDDEGNPVVNGKLWFYKSGTNSALETFADELQTIPLTNPVPVQANGRVPNIFYSGSARVILTANNPDTWQQDVQVWERDPVGGDRTLGQLELWDIAVTYDAGDLVKGSNGEYYKSISGANQGNDPTTNPAQWELVRFLGTWNINILYSTGVVVQTTSGNLWKSAKENQGNDPESDNGTNWLPALDGIKIPEVNALEERTTTSIEQTGGGVLTTLRVNSLQDASAYTLPPASSIGDNQWLVISQAQEFSNLEPTVTVDGSDTIATTSGTDTSILFDQVNRAEIRLTSNGVDQWSIS